MNNIIKYSGDFADESWINAENVKRRANEASVKYNKKLMKDKQSHNKKLINQCIYRVATMAAVGVSSYLLVGTGDLSSFLASCIISVCTFGVGAAIGCVLKGWER